MKRYAQLAVVVFAVLSARTLSAAIIYTYTYTASDFQSVQNNIPYADFPTYSTSDFVSWTVNLDVPIDSAAPLSSDYGPNGTQNVLSFSITDGVQTLNTFSASDVFDFGANGWALNITQQPGLFGVGSVAISSGCGQVNSGVITVGNYGGISIPGAANSGWFNGELGAASCFDGAAGSFIESSAPGPSTPEPSALEMMLSAGILLLGAAHNRGQAFHALRKLM